MAHEDKGHYAAKHKDQKINKTITQKIQALSNDNCISCVLAHKGAKELNIPPSEIGVQIDLLEYRISECQLGLFGYTGGQKKIDPDIKIAPDLNEYLDKASKDGRISCLESWDTAKKLNTKRLDMGSACEKKNIKIKPCQLGAF
ncbi:MAG: hypothetical protein HN417_09605 [Desulfobacula sp.]|jgi:hypothetical protein|nr:hypothetical protein [Desulfobacula sp.]MBT6339594.1 hypothetical protein [Desulfobacula sp.]MBT7260686.1 hypothetical protein [Desulfobacula sp.]